MIIKPKLKDDGSDGVFLDSNLLLVRIANCAYEVKSIIPDEYIIRPGTFAFKPHELDEHFDSVAIKATIQFYIDANNEDWCRKLNEADAKIKEAIHMMPDLDDIEEPDLAL